MGEKLVIGPFNRGLRTDKEPFAIDNESFPTLINAYQWRGRIKRKRGTQFLGRLQRFLGTTDAGGNLTVTIVPGNLGTAKAFFTVDTDIFTDPGGASPVNLITNGSGAATLDRTTGVLTITGSIPLKSVIYFPQLPVMGLEELQLNTNSPAGTLAFDTKYSYNITTALPSDIYDVSFFKNPTTLSYDGYTAKASPLPLNWNGEDYQQFWTVNYQGALWATNGVKVSFTTTNIGMQFKAITGVTIDAAGPPAKATLTIAAHGLTQGDFIFVNEVQGITGINFQTGYVISANPQAANTVQVEFPNATLGGAYITGGIAQYLTANSDSTKDCIRWYDGDPTNATTPFSTLTGHKGWVNFMPPLSQLNYSISDLPLLQYYLVGAKIIIPFKDRLLFLGPVVQASTGSPIYLKDTIIYSQNGTPYYTCSYTNTPSSAKDTPTSSSIVFTPILVPVNQTATAPAFFEDQTGFGGFVSAGIDQAIQTASPNEDVLIVGFDRLQARLVYRGDDIVPFSLFSINSEFGSGSTFSVINMDQGVLTKGQRGYIMSNQEQASRIDLEIPDQVFEANLVNNGAERVTAQRDFIKEWIYFTYPSNQFKSKFPTQTLQYNYRDNSWAIFNESYTTYGAFRLQSGFTWATVGLTYSSWNAWNDPWNAGSSTLLQPFVIAGNTQGFILYRDTGTTSEATSLSIQNIASNVVTSPDHCLNSGDYITISGALGTVGASINGKIFSVGVTTNDTFTLNPSVTGTYLGGGLITRMYVPFIQTKQFPTSWGLARKTRIGVQQYLLTTTDLGQIQLLIFLSQNNTNAFNTFNPSLDYSTVLYTCVESTNLGLLPASANMTPPQNTNLQMMGEPVTPNAGITGQNQIWHRMNTSLIGDTVQIGFTMSDEQMRDTNFNNQFEEIELHGIILDLSPSQVLA